VDDVGETRFVSEDYKQKMRDAAGGLLLQVAAGEISEEDALREVDIWKAWIEMIRIATDMGTWSCPPEEHMRREATLMEKWPEACRRAGVGAMPMPDDVMRAITSFVGRVN
jgi:hypothetical protein